ncbi:MAG: c-type cytochrome [Pirellulales bacterium]|nr:c-type cytochrome [Pirellulales bacterium]
MSQDAVASEADEDDETEYSSGLIATYRDASGGVCRRIDPALAFQWRDRAPDPRIEAQGWTAEWGGMLSVLAPGEYRLHVYAAGRVTVELDGRSVIDASPTDDTWLESAPLELAFGEHALHVRYEPKAPEPRLGLYWSGPQFQLEPVPPWQLFHKPTDEDLASFERGRTLVHGLRCGACHAGLAEQHVLPAPALDHLAGHISTGWLTEWIQHAGHQSNTNASEHQVASRMPSLGLSSEESHAIAAYLLADAPEEYDARPLETKKISIEAGATLFRSVGCLACHRVGDLGVGGLFGGGDLTQVADKRPAEYFVRWLREPATLNASHRMPIFTLSDEEVANLAAYLSTLKSPNDSHDAHVSAAADVRERGAKLVAEHRCANCHQLPQTTALTEARSSIATPIPNESKADCLTAPDVARKRPGFLLPPQQAAEVRAYLAALPPTSATPASDDPSRAYDGQLVLAERNCLSCHARGLSPGIAATLPALAEVDETLSPRLAALAPPALNSIGDKLHDEALAAAIATTAPRLRPWLDLRMPRFSLGEEESRVLVEMFVDEDRIPSLPADQEQTVDDAARLHLAGSRLVTSAGFGCTSCHAIGEVAPVEVALAAHGTDLAELGRRIRRPWYDRWVRNPARIVPRMEMPSIQLAIRGVLDEELSAQLAAVWHVLNEPGFVPPPPNAVRVVRARNLPDEHEAHLLTDVFELGKHKFIKPFVVGLPNRQSVLFDLRENQLAGWWIGDAARQRTRGKTWYWEPGGEFLTPPIDRASEVSLEAEGTRREPLAGGQFATECDEWQHTKDGLRFEYRLHFAPHESDSADRTTLHVAQQFAARRNEAASDETGVRREFAFRGLPRGTTLRLALLPPPRDGGSYAMAQASATEFAWRAPIGACRVRVVSPADATIELERGRPLVAIPAPTDGTPLSVALEYLTSAPVDHFPLDTPVAVNAPSGAIDVVPGFTAERLPLVDEIMPTGLAWRPDGTLVFSSLKGQVWQARDTDGDSLEDTAQVLSDDLAAPYGVAIAGDAVDVINKYALLRLHDDDGDGRAERTERLVSGWGHTHDYHDWAVGLVASAAGEYYIALPCQQDTRDEPAAYLRGRALRLAPREPTPDDPARFALEEWCAGLRFPMGLALNREGDLFATDNQGNYTPFNELNHLRQGKRYGFINKLENRPGFRPEATLAAIDIPHPWTRSVNGICFLNTPDAVRDELGRDLFGPFEGHLLGCEYDTRSLVRMSLEQVGGEYQGAVYPFSRAPAAGEESLLGPLVCQVAPDGDLYVGNIRDSAWGGGANNGSIVRLCPRAELPPGIAEVRATNDGFTIAFTRPAERAQLENVKFYSVSSFRRIPTSDYGGPDQDRRTEKILAAEATPDGRQVRLRLEELREGFVYEIRIRPMDGVRWEPAEAFYTLRRRLE